MENKIISVYSKSIKQLQSVFGMTFFIEEWQHSKIELLQNISFNSTLCNYPFTDFFLYFPLTWLTMHAYFNNLPEVLKYLKNEI